MTESPEAGRERLELLSLDHAHALEDFELTNRAFFARHISDRGDEWYAHLDERLAAAVAENDTGRSLMFVIVDSSDAILGRVNLYDVDRPTLTELGFRIAESAQGRGVATRGVLAALDVAREHGVRTVTARASTDNAGSQGVLERCGFTSTGPVDAPPGSPRSFLGYRLDL